MPETFFTVWTNVFERGGLQPGETLLVHGGTSGIGTTAIQLAKAFGATRDRHRRQPREMRGLPASSARTSRSTTATQDFVAAVKDATGGQGVDVILDMVGGDYIARNYEAAAVDGRIVQIAFLQGTQGRGRFPPPDAEAADPYRLDAAAALAGGEGRRSPRRARGEGLALCRPRAVPAGDPRDLRLRRGGEGPCADGERRSISARSCSPLAPRDPDGPRCNASDAGAAGKRASAVSCVRVRCCRNLQHRGTCL